MRQFINQSSRIGKTTGLVVLGFIATTLQAAGNAPTNNVSLSSIEKKASLKLNGAQYRQLYARAGTANVCSTGECGKAIGSLTIQGLPANGYTLKATLKTIDVTIEKDGAAFLDKAGNTIPNKDVFDAADLAKIESNSTYQWYRSPGDCSDKKTMPKVLVTDSTENREKALSWCPIKNGNGELATGKTYTLQEKDINNVITVTITYINANNELESYSSADNIGGICKVYPDYTNTPSLSCEKLNNYIFSDSFEQNQ